VADLSQTLISQARAFGFFQAVVLLEEYFRHDSACTDPIREGRIRFESDTATTFPVADIASCHAGDDHVALRLPFMSLLGAASPLPQYFADEVLRHGDEDTALSDFLDMFANRLYALFYQAWNKHHLVRCLHGDPDDPFVRMVTALAGASDEECTTAGSAHAAYAGLFASATRSADGLATLVADSLGGVPAKVVEHVPRWAPIDRVAQLGLDACLGDTAMVGNAVWDIGTRFRIVVGPLGRTQYETLLHERGVIDGLAGLVQRYLAEPLEFDIEVKLDGSELVPVALGQPAALGETASLGRPDEDTVAHAVVYTTEPGSAR
jgi:type VI secretion system protein ImpH